MSRAMGKMTKKITCIECPIGCALFIDVENCKVTGVTGNKCPKGEKYAVSEIENPMRILTSSVLAEGMDLKMIPVRTDKPIPKNLMFKAADEIRKIKLKRPVNAGDVIMDNFMGLGASLVTTRGCHRSPTDSACASKGSAFLRFDFSRHPSSSPD